MDNWPRTREIFEQAVTLPQAERLSYVTTVCGEDAVLRDQLERLLAAHLRAASFLETPGAMLLGDPDADRRLEGRRLGSYLVSARIGAGGMGQVYLATDERLQRPVALKCLPADAHQDAGRLRRFTQEARATSALNHPNIVTVYDIVETTEGRFIAMEFVEGKSLRDIVAECPAARLVAHIGRQSAEALRVAHAAGIIHRDIKPENIMMRSDEYIKLLDFGLARLSGPAAPIDATATSQPTAGRIAGTWRYMSPEQSRGEEIGSATDIFSLGLVLYELATAQHPFGNNAPATLWRAEPAYLPAPPSAVNAAFPPAFDELVLDMLQKDARLRPTAEAVERALAPLSAAPSRDAQTPAYLPRPVRNIVGREVERAALRGAYGSARAGRGSMISVCGEPGVGKTTLVEDFLATLGDPNDCRILRGRCSERLAGTDVYLPWFDALDGLSQVVDRGGALDAIRTLAPSWYAQVAPTASDGGHAARPEMASTQPERLKRELAALLRHLCQTAPLVVFFEDLHWADSSTIDLLSFIGDRLDGMSCLFVVTYRPSDLLLAKHPFALVKQGLQARGTCCELLLQFLTAADIERYLAGEFPEHRFPREFGARIHARTEGSPLFMSNLVGYFREQGIIVKDRGRWTLTGPLDALNSGVPESVRSMIDLKIAQLDEADRQLLEVASVQGNEFDSAVVASVLSLGEGEVEAGLRGLGHVHGFVSLVDDRQFPDFTWTSRYRFIHVLYQNALYAAIAPARRQQLAVALGDEIERHWGTQNADVANELAVLFETAHEHARSGDYYRSAALRAGGLFASAEGEALARRGLAVVEQLPPGPERLGKELSLQLVLGNALIATVGYAAPEVENTFLRAGEICRLLGETPRLLPVHFGLSAFHLVKGQGRQAQTIGRELLAIAERHGDPAAIVGHRLLGITSFILGELTSAREHLSRASAMYDPARHGALAQLYGGEPEMSTRNYLGITLWLLGYPDQALASNDTALGLARDVTSAQSRAHALAFAALQHQFRHDSRRVGELIREMLELTTDQGLRLWQAYGGAMHGWLLTSHGDIDEGIDELHANIAGLRAFGARHFLPYFLCQLADAYRESGRPTASFETLAEAQATIEATEERFWEAEVSRLRGEAFASAAVGRPGDAEREFQQAIAAARHQEARSLELRAATSLGRLWRQQGRLSDARMILGEIHGWFTEGQATTDLLEASALLRQLA